MAAIDEALDHTICDYQTTVRISSPEGFISDIGNVELDGNGTLYIDAERR